MLWCADRKGDFAMKQTAQSNVKRIALGTLAALVSYVALLALVSLLIVRGTVGETKIVACVWIFAFLAAFAGAKLASRGSGNNAVLCAACAAAFWLLIQLTGFLSNDALDFTRSAMLLLPVALGGLAAYLLRGGKSKKGKGRRPKRK